MALPDVVVAIFNPRFTGDDLLLYKKLAPGMAIDKEKVATAKAIGHGLQLLLQCPPGRPQLFVEYCVDTPALSTVLAMQKCSHLLSFPALESSITAHLLVTLRLKLLLVLLFIDSIGRRQILQVGECRITANYVQRIRP